MSDYVIEVKDAQPNVMVRRDESGATIEVEVRREEYTVPPEGTYDLEITGFAKPFEMTSELYGESVKTRVEFAIVAGKGNGHRFTDLYTWTVGPKSNLGKLIGKARGMEIPKGSVDVVELILPRPPIRLTAYVSNSEDRDDQGRPKYARVVLDSVKPLGVKTEGYDPFKAA